MYLESEFKILTQRHQEVEFDAAPTKKDLKEVLKGTMVVHAHIPSEFAVELTALIKEKQNDLLGKKLWLAVLLIDNDALLSPEPLILDPQKDIVNQIGGSAAWMVRSREAYDGAAFFKMPAHH